MVNIVDAITWDLSSQPYGSSFTDIDKLTRSFHSRFLHRNKSDFKSCLQKQHMDLQDLEHPKWVSCA